MRTEPIQWRDKTLISSRLSVSQIVHEHRALSPDMAMRLERLLGTGAESWLRMQ